MTKIKICGLRTVADVQKVNPYRPEYVGFVFAKSSKRNISADSAAELAGALHPGIRRVGVFVNQTADEIVSLVQRGIIHAVQLHGEEDEAFLQALKKQVDCPLIRAVPVGDSPPVKLDSAADFLLFDRASSQRGGTGASFDWQLLSGVQRPYFLAGGLRTDNISQALALTAPYCVDVSSGVETDGIKDEEKIRLFIQRVRGAR